MAAKKVMAYGKFRYRSRYRDVDSRSWKCKTFDTKDEAEDFEASLRLAKSGRVFVRKQSTQTLRQFWHEYLHEYALLDLQAATVEGHKQAWSKWIEPTLLPPSSGVRSLETTCKPSPSARTRSIIGPSQLATNISPFGETVRRPIRSLERPSFLR